MNLKPIIQSEVSQKEKNNYYTLTHIYAIKKDGTDGPICKAVMETQSERTDLRMEGEHGTNGESSMETGTLPW